MDSFTGTTALVTGASKGIGAAYARELAARGAALVLVARSADALAALAAELEAAHGTRVTVVEADLGERDAATTVVATLQERGVEVDLLVNNAGMGAVGPFLTRPLEPNLASVDLNVTAVLALVHAVGGEMLRRGRGGIVNVGSVAGFVPMPHQASYGATKAFVLSFTEALAEEVRGSGVHVMGVHPGPVSTGFFDGTTASIPAGAVTPEQIATRSLDDFERGAEASFPGSRADRVNALLPRLLPRRAATRLAGVFTRRAGFHRVETAGEPPAPQ